MKKIGKNPLTEILCGAIIILTNNIIRSENMDKFSGSKKYLSILISIFLLVCSFAMLSGCHKHKYVSENIEATCLKGAYIKSTCKKCGEIEISEETSAPLGHKFDGDIC